MNKQQLLSEIYKYFCVSLHKDYKPHPKEICHIQNCFEQLEKLIKDEEAKIKVDGYKKE